MKPNAVDFLAPSALLAWIIVAGSLTAPLVQAQQVYRMVGPDGKVTFSDRPAPAATSTSVGTGNASMAGSATPAGLPFELRQVAAKYPVTLYTSDNCLPCSSGRSLLTSRGIPFAEKTVSTPEDNQALQRISGETSLPFMTIGSQQLKGFSDAEWTQFLTAAGYPASSVLPASYRAPAAAPLVTMAAAPAATAASGAPASPASSVPAARLARPLTPPAGNPSGIKF